MSGGPFTIIDDWQIRTTSETEALELARRAEAAGRPVARDLDERAAYLGIPASVRAERLASLDAPDFTLPDADDRPHSLSDHRGKKIFLVAYASW